MTCFLYLPEFSIVYVLFVIIIPITSNWILKLSNVSFFGYSRSQKRHRCYCPTLHKFVISADVTFFRSTPYFGKEAFKSTSLEPEDNSCPF